MQTAYKVFDILNSTRKNAYSFYRHFDEPYFNMTVPIDVSRMRAEAKEQQYSFSLSCIFYALQAANTIPNFKLRFLHEETVLLDTTNGGSTILFDDESFGFAYYDFTKDHQAFQLKSKSEIDQVKHSKKFEPQNERFDLIYFSSIPWVSFTSFKNAQDKVMNSSIPKIVFGKYYTAQGKIMLPVNVEVHHALMDGYHVAKFLNLMEQLCQ